MKNKLLFVCISLLFHFAASSQTGYSIDPEYFELSFNEDLSDVNSFRVEANMENNSDVSLNINWELVNFDMPNTWAVSVSDKDIDYVPGVTSNQLALQLQAGETIAPFNIHLYPNQTPGCGYFEALITSETNGSIIDTIEYTIAVNDDSCVISATDSYSVDSQIKIYPSPFGDHFMINSESEIEYLSLYTLQGKRILKENHYSTNPQRINTSDINEGIYILEIISKEGKRIVRKLVKGDKTY